MDAIIGRYRAHLEESGLVLTHPSRISFDLTAEEALGLLDFIKVYQQVLQKMARDAEPLTDPQLERIVLEKENRRDR